MPEIELSLDAAELNLVLIALGQLPYVQVHELIARIQAQAGPQLVAAHGGASAGAESRR